MNREWALGYASKGLRVFPAHAWAGVGCSCGRAGACDRAAKHPRTPHGVKDATTDAGIITKWWTRWPLANIGIATGGVSGVVVLDIDPRHGGDASLFALEARVGVFPSTLVSRTGGGGRHLWFRSPDRVRVGNSVSTLGEGVDVRGEGGYVLVPPSNHASGGHYEWAAGPRSPAPLPARLLSLLISTSKQSDAGRTCHSDVQGLPRGTRTTTRGREALERSLLRLRDDAGGSRHDRILRAASRLGRAVAIGDLAAEVATAALIEAGLAMGKPRGEVSRTVRDGLLFGVRRVRLEYPDLIPSLQAAGTTLTLPSRLPRRLTAVLRAEAPSKDPDRDLFGACVALAGAGMGMEFIARAVAGSPLKRALDARGEAAGCWLRHTIATAKRLAARAPTRSRGDIATQTSATSQFRT